MTAADFDTSGHALILAGGFGTRLSSVVKDVPKPMAPVAEKPFLDYLVQFLKIQGFHRITLLTGYKEDVIRFYFDDGSRFGVQISYSHETSPLGTGGAIAQAMKLFPAKKYLVLNGDSFFGLDLKDFLSKADKPINMALKKMTSTSRYGSVKLDADQLVVRFEEKNSLGLPGLINSGIYLLDATVQNYFLSGKFSLETDVFEKLSKENKIRGVVCDGEFIDIGIPEDYTHAQTLLPQWMKKYDTK